MGNGERDDDLVEFEFVSQSTVRGPDKCLAPVMPSNGPALDWSSDQLQADLLFWGCD